MPKAPTKKALCAEAENMFEAIQLFFEYVEEPPPKNCSCHISPPCGDCAEHSAMRELFATFRGIARRVRGEA